MNSETHAKEKVAKDAQVMKAIIMNMGIEEWEPKVIQQMLEYSYKYDNWEKKVMVVTWWLTWFYLQVRDRSGLWRQVVVPARA